MKNPQKDDFRTWTNDAGMAARYAPIHDMVTELLARIDPDGYTNMLEDLRAQQKPESTGETHVIAIHGRPFWRIHGCFYLENEILKSGHGGFRLPERRPRPGVWRASSCARAKAAGYSRNCTDMRAGYRESYRAASACWNCFAKNRKYAEARDGKGHAGEAQVLHFRYTIGCAPPALHLPSRPVRFRLIPQYLCLHPLA